MELEGIHVKETGQQQRIYSDRADDCGRDYWSSGGHCGPQLCPLSGEIKTVRGEGAARRSLYLRVVIFLRAEYVRELRVQYRIYTGGDGQILFVPNDHPVEYRYEVFGAGLRQYRQRRLYRCLEHG